MPHPRSLAARPRRESQVITSVSEFESRTLAVERVSRMVAGGRRFRFRALVAVGNRNGVVGIGTGKGLEVAKAVEKATRRAHSSRFTVPRKAGTIPRDVKVKSGTAEIIMRPARPGHGIVAGSVVRTICDLAGITDISAKIFSRSTNTLSNARAAVEGLRTLAERIAVAEERKGKKRQDGANNTSQS